MLVWPKELEILEKLSEKVERISVSGGFDGLLTNLLAPMSKQRRDGYVPSLLELPGGIELTDSRFGDTNRR